MRWDKLTLKVQEAVQGATDLADRLSHQALEPEHLLAALLDDKEGMVSRILAKAGASPEKMRAEIEVILNKFPRVENAPGHTISPRLGKTMQLAWEEAQHLKDEYLSVEHVILGLLNEQSGELPKLLKKAGLNKDKIWQALQAVRGGQRVTDQAPEMPARGSWTRSSGGKMKSAAFSRSWLGRRRTIRS
jgi:ATP-dependent Clp protease ATP-binding subunit ClpB